MYGGELTHQILKRLRKGMTHRAIATELHRHPNTITAHVKWLRQHQLYDDHEVLNKIDDRLTAELGTMSIPQLLTWRGQLVPQRIEATSDVTVTETVPTLDFRSFTDDEREEIRRSARRLRRLSTRGEE